MPIPDFQTLMLPVLKATSDKKEHRMRDIIDNLATVYELTDEETKQLLPSGGSFFI